MPKALSMKKYNITSALLNKDAAWSTAWSTVQQLIVAASTYFIVEAIRAVTANNLDLGLRYIAAFVASLVLVYIPNAISMIYLEKWRISSTESFIRSFIKYNKGKTSFGHARNKVKIESWLTHESFTVFENVTALLYQILSTFMNSLFNIIVIAIALDTEILGYYFLAGGVLVASNYIFRGAISEASLAMQSNRKELTASMLSAWQNIFVGNHYNFNNWNQKFSSKINNAKTSAVHYNFVKSMISSGTVCLALLVVAAGNWIYLWNHRSSLPAIAALFITLPRQLQIIQSIFAFFNLAISWNGSFQQLTSLGAIIQPNDTKSDSKKYIQFHQIEFVNDGRSMVFNDFDTLTNQVNRTQNGRWTLRGRNGAGKSTLLSLLKENFAEKGFLLPTNYEDLCFDSDFLNNSDGNRLVAVFDMISRLDNIKFIILDEWDANLDRHNLVRINEAIDALAMNKVVLESRHRV